MAEDDSVIDLTSSLSYSLADHNRLNNVVIILDTDDSLREEENLQNNNRRRSGGRKRRYSKTRAGQPRVPVQDLCTPNKVQNKRRSQDSKKECKKIIITEEPEVKKAKPSLGSCPICFDEFSGQAIASTKCGHVFCLECLKQALKREPRCPTCRTTLRGKSGYHSLFL